jgi:hypothetical protein
MDPPIIMKTATWNCETKYKNKQQNMNRTVCEVNEMFLHPAIIGLFLAVFAILAIIGAVRLFGERRYGLATFLLITMVVFAFSSFTAFTLKV